MNKFNMAACHLLLHAGLPTGAMFCFNFELSTPWFLAGGRKALLEPSPLNGRPQHLIEAARSRKNSKSDLKKSDLKKSDLKIGIRWNPLESIGIRWNPSKSESC